MTHTLLDRLRKPDPFPYLSDIRPAPGRTDSQAKSRLLTPAGRAARVPSSCGRGSNERSRPEAGPSNPKRPRGALWIGAPGRTRTCYPRLRRPMLYPDELQALRRFLQVDLASLNVVVGAEGFEPPTPCSQSRCATRLRYAPIFRAHERPPWTRERDDTQEPECGQLPRSPHGPPARPSYHRHPTRAAISGLVLAIADVHLQHGALLN